MGRHNPTKVLPLTSQTKLTIILTLIDTVTLTLTNPNPKPNPDPTKP